MTASSTDRVIVIGAGLGGLAAACTLAARGHAVLLLERSKWLGGKAAVLQAQGFRFDMGPTIVTLPRVLRKIFSEAGRALEDYLELVPLDPQWRSFFSDGSTLDLVADPDQMKIRLRDYVSDPRVPLGYERFMQAAARLHEISDRFFFWKSVESVRDTLDLRRTLDVAVLRDLWQLRMGQTVSGMVRAHISDPRVAQMIDHFTQYVGSAPDTSPAVLCGIAHMQTHEGVWYPLGGTGAIPAALEQLARELGVEVQTDCGVRRILIRHGRVEGVETSQGRRIDCRAVVSNCDSVLTYRELVGGQSGQRFAKSHRGDPACSGVVLYLGLKRRYDQLLHHNFLFSRDPHEEFDWIYRRGEPAPDPTCYLCAPAATDPTVAPEGGEALYVLVHTPFLRERHDWSVLFPRYRRVILQKLASTAGLEDLPQQIVFEQALTPHDIQRRYHVPAGAIYGLASHGRFWGAFKPGNRRTDVRGLYLAGGAAHPGPGMPMVLMSGWIAADSLDTDRPSAASSSSPSASSTRHRLPREVT